jgi:lipooligosaccharide transport system permease protein
MKTGLDLRLPHPTRGALAVWRRNALVWSKLALPGLLFNFGEPLLYLVGLGYGLGRFIGEMDGISYFAFLASGLLASAAMNTASYEGLFSVYTRMVPQQTYDGMLATPLDVDDIVAGETLWCATKGLISSSAILIVGYAAGALSGFGAVLCLPLFILSGLCFAGPAMAMSAISPSYDFFNYYITLVMTPMFIFCGVFYPVAGLPQAVQDAVQVLPLTHAVALIRPLATGQAIADPLLHAGVLSAYALGGFYVAVVMIRRRLVK